MIVFDPVIFGLPATGPRVSWIIRMGTFVYFIDGRDGKIIHRYRDLPSLKIRSTFDANMTNNIPGTLVIKEAGPIDGAVIPDDAKFAHEYAGATYDYYFAHFKRDSYDNNPAGGSPLTSTVRYGQLHNALWNRQLKQMIYGPGYAVAPDVVGHEITHGVVGAEAKLLYFGESGAADEAFADFFGIMVASQISGKPDWKIGTKLPGFSKEHPLRNFADPNLGAFDPSLPFSAANQGQPDDYSEKVSAGSPICANTTDRDNDCVHFNSGILSSAFYLAANGGSGHHSHIKVNALGPAKLEQILYRALTAENLTNSSQFRDVALGSIEACIQLSGNAMFTIAAKDCSNLQDAYRAVGIPVN